MSMQCSRFDRVAGDVDSCVELCVELLRREHEADTHGQPDADDDRQHPADAPQPVALADRPGAEGRPHARRPRGGYVPTNAMRTSDSNLLSSFSSERACASKKDRASRPT